jgi:dCTP deaminase
MTGLLCDWELKRALDDGEIKIEGFNMTTDFKMIQPNSIDVRLGDSFVMYRKKWKAIDPYDDASINSGTKHVQKNNIIIRPGDFILGRTHELITLPDNIAASIEGKSSLARLGLVIHSTGGWIDAGFRGTITLELSNVNKRAIRLTHMMPIGQIVFHRISSAAMPYNVRKESKYMNQVDATTSRYYKNKVA